ncbi:MAG: hypothetical protein ACTHO8_14060 [Solirubrobacterales bacterium]
MLVFREERPLSPAEGEALYQEHLDKIAGRSQEFAQGKAEVLDALAPHDAFDLLAALQISSSRVWPKGQNPPLHTTEFMGELLALLLVERGSRGAAVSGAGEEAFVDALRRYERFAEAVVALLPDVLVPPPSPLDKSSTAELDRIRSRTASLHLLLPFSENEDQVQQTTAELFGAPIIRSHIVKTLGIDADAALALTDAAGELTQRGYNSAVRQVERFKRWHGYGSELSFSVRELAEAAGVEHSQAEQFSARFSLAFDATSYELGRLTTAARLQPFLRDGEILMPISVPTLRRSLRRSLAALLNPRLPGAGAGDKKAFSLFTRERGRWLEERAMRALGEALRPDWSELNVHFRLPDDRAGEIDGLLRLDDTFLILQAKSGATRIDTEVGDPVRFRQTLTELIGGENFRQHRDAISALTSKASFARDPAGEEALRLELADIARVLPLHITLEDLSAIGAQPWLLVDAGLAEDYELPWIVGVDEMELLLEYFELPAVFVHFLTRRLKANRSRQLLAQDEIDWAVRYGEDELLWADLPPDHPYAQRQFAVLEEHYDFELWQLARQAGQKAKRARPNLSAGVRKLLAHLDRSRPPGWLGFSLALLDLNRTQRPSVVKLWREQMESDRSKEAPPLSIGFGPEGEVEVGFSVLREEREVHSEVDAVLRKWCEEQLQRHGASEWWAVVAPYRARDPVRWCCGCRAPGIGGKLFSRAAEDGPD